MIYVIIASILIIAILYLYFHNQVVRLRSKYKKDVSKIKGEWQDMSKRLIREHIYLCLSQMDTTARYYVEEDEANREMTTCLSLLGHHAVYHAKLDNQRFADILVDNNTLIEGKLDPQLADIDRLIGQLNDYSGYPYNICVVIYGFISEPMLSRLQIQVVSKFPQVSLLYLKDPNRIRRQVPIGLRDGDR